MILITRWKNIDPRDTVSEVAVKRRTSWIYLSRYPGIYTDDTRSDGASTHHRA